MDGLYAEYETGRGSVISDIYRHLLVAIVETALRSSNATAFSHNVLDRLQVDLRKDTTDTQVPALSDHMTPFTTIASTNEKTVWDVLELSYIVPDPLLAIVHQGATEDYRTLFRFLFAMRKVEFMLNLTWRQNAVLQHALHTAAQYNAIQASTSPTYARAIVLLRQISMTRQAMMHFVVNLKSYVMFEVLEGGWHHLVHTLEQANTLDDVIQAHDAYLQGILRKSLLQSDRAAGMGRYLQQLLAIADRFCGYQYDVFGEALLASERAALKRKEAEARMGQGDWGFESASEVKDEETFFGLSDASKFEEANKMAQKFDKLIRKLLNGMDEELNGIADLSETSSIQKNNADDVTIIPEYQDDLDSLRFLSFQLDNNQYYGINTKY
jgi:gamma-tubulin complex component 3